MNPGHAALRCRTVTPPGGECLAPGGECGDQATVGIITMGHHPEMQAVRVLMLVPVCAEHAEHEVRTIKADRDHDTWAAIALSDALAGGLR